MLGNVLKCLPINPDLRPGFFRLLACGMHHVLFLDQVTGVLDQIEKLVNVSLVPVETFLGRLFSAKCKDT